LIVLLQLKVKKHYDMIACHLSISQLNLKKVDFKVKYTHIVIVPIASLNKATIGALQYAQSICENVIALNVSTDMESLEKLKHRWSELDTDIILVSKYSPFRAVITPLLDYIKQIADATAKNEKVTVIVPQFITHDRWGEVLHNHTGFLIRESLLNHHNIVVSTFPYDLTEEDICL
jgi:predicted amidophosphoribosyltransferase